MKIMKKPGLLVVAEILMISKRMGFNPCGPVWGGDYPGEIPSEIAEWLDDTGNRGE